MVNVAVVTAATIHLVRDIPCVHVTPVTLHVQVVKQTTIVLEIWFVLTGLVDVVIAATTHLVRAIRSAPVILQTHSVPAHAMTLVTIHPARGMTIARATPTTHRVAVGVAEVAEVVVAITTSAGAGSVD